MIKIDAADIMIRKYFTLQIGLGDILERILPELAVLVIQNSSFPIPLGHDPISEADSKISASPQFTSLT